MMGTYHLQINGQQLSNLTLAQVREALALNPTTAAQATVWTQGWGTWRPAMILVPKPLRPYALWTMVFFGVSGFFGLIGIAIASENNVHAIGGVVLATGAWLAIIGTMIIKVLDQILKVLQEK